MDLESIIGTAPILSETPVAIAIELSNENCPPMSYLPLSSVRMRSRGASAHSLLSRWLQNLLISSSLYSTKDPNESVRVQLESQSAFDFIL